MALKVGNLSGINGGIRLNHGMVCTEEISPDVYAFLFLNIFLSSHPYLGLVVPHAGGCAARVIDGDVATQVEQEPS